MAEWFKRRLESLFDNLIFTGIVAGGVAVWTAINSLPLPAIIFISVLTFIVILVVLRLIWFFKLKSKQVEIGGLRANLKIGARVKDIKTAGFYDRAFGGQSEGDKQIIVDVPLAPVKPITLDIVALELWGKRFEAKIQRDVAPFDLIKLTPLTLTGAYTYTLVFDVPKESAIDIKEARIYALAGNLAEWFSDPFPINFGSGK